MMLYMLFHTASPFGIVFSCFISFWMENMSLGMQYNHIHVRLEHNPACHGHNNVDGALHTHMCVYTHTHTHTHTHIYIYIDTYMCVCVTACLYVFLTLYGYVLSFLLVYFKYRLCIMIYFIPLCDLCVVV